MTMDTPVAIRLLVRIFNAPNVDVSVDGRSIDIGDVTLTVDDDEEARMVATAAWSILGTPGEWPLRMQSGGPLNADTRPLHGREVDSPGTCCLCRDPIEEGYKVTDDKGQTYCEDCWAP